MEQNAVGVSNRQIRFLTYMMFLIFAMTTDAVGVIIPEIISEYGLSLTQASAFHYATMIAIALSGVGLGFLADRIGRKPTILMGLALFAIACFLFPIGQKFIYFLVLLILTGTAVGMFKTAALALIGDISKTSIEHTSTMNMAEGFFGVGAVIGPAIVVYLLGRGVSWTYLYIIAGVCAVILILIASMNRYPQMKKNEAQKIDWRRTLHFLRDPYALGFSMAIALYVVVEAAIYVWMPTLLLDYEGSVIWLATYALSIFFIFRALGRFVGAWVLNHVRWQSALLLFTGLIFGCYLASNIYGIAVGVWLLPISGLFMSIIYPTLNSKGLKCFESDQQGAVAGIILFFTAAAAAIGPLVMALISDAFGHIQYGFGFCTLCAGILFVMAIWNYKSNPASVRLAL